MSHKFLYSVFGLVLESDIPLPELTEVDTGIPDVTVKYGIAPPLDNVSPVSVDHGHVWPGGALLQHPAIGKLFIAGPGMLVEPRDRIDQRDLRAFILGPGLGALLYSKSLVPLHVSAIEHNECVFGITGPSGAGKSTLAYAFDRLKSLRVFTDDVAALRPEDLNAGVLIYAGPPRIKLWSDALQQFGVSEKGLIRDVSRTEKFHLGLSGEQLGQAMRLRHLIILKHNQHIDRPQISMIQGAAAFLECATSFYRPQYAVINRESALVLRVASALATSVRVYKLERPRKFDQIELDIELILNAVSKRTCNSLFVD